MNKASFAQKLLVNTSLPRLEGFDRAAVRIGFLVPLSGPEESWGKPGLDGCQLWMDWLNERGGLMVAGKRHRVEIVAYDSARSAGQTLKAARELVEQMHVRLVLTLGGDSFAPALPFLMQRRMLVGTLLPSDLTPDTPYLIAPVEVHPFFNATGVEWLARQLPPARRVALCTQTDSLGLPSLAVYRTAFDAVGWLRVQELRYKARDTDADAIISAMIAANPDVLCWCTSTPPMVHALTEAAYRRGFKGKILSCVADGYPRLIERTSLEFMEGFTFQFPDFDDPHLADATFFFRQPQAFFDTYNARFPNEWGAVSWEYASILDLWHSAVELADTTAPVSVLAAMKRAQQVPHTFGPARWTGRELFGTDNALIGDWPVVAIRNGRARIQEFGSVLSWLDLHGEVLARQLDELGQSWHQRLRRPVTPLAKAASGPRSTPTS